MMKIAKAQNTQPNSTSRRFDTKIASAKGMEKYAIAITASDTTCSQISSGSHKRHIPWGEYIDVFRRRSKNAIMPVTAICNWFVLVFGIDWLPGRLLCRRQFRLRTCDVRARPGSSGGQVVRRQRGHV